MKTTKPELLNVAEAAEVLRKSPTTLNTWRSRKTYQLPYIRSGGTVYYDRADLLAFLESRKVRG
jgi:hypothetical protein